MSSGHAPSHSFCYDWAAHYYDAVHGNGDKNGVWRPDLKDEVCKLWIAKLRGQIGCELEGRLPKAFDMKWCSIGIVGSPLIRAVFGAGLDFVVL
jgi:hypothetical protein